MGGAGGWLRHPGGLGGLALLFTGAGLTVIAAVLIVEVHLPIAPPETGKDSVERAADALETIAETLGAISEAPPGARNLSVTVPRNLSVAVRLDENQWKDVHTATTELHKFGAGIAGSMSGISEETRHIKASIEGMTGPWGCISPSCWGTVRFPHNEPDLPEDTECDKLWPQDGGKIPGPTQSDLEGIVEKLKMHKPSPIWIVGHASTLGDKDRNDTLSLKRARFVTRFVKCRLKNMPNISGTCAAGEKASRESLRYPDFRYRMVQVLSGQPPEFLCDYELQCEKEGSTTNYNAKREDKDPMCPRISLIP